MVLDSLQQSILDYSNTHIKLTPLIIKTFGMYHRYIRKQKLIHCKTADTI